MVVSIAVNALETPALALSSTRFECRYLNVTFPVPDRNPDLSKVEIEAFLREFLGVKLVLWLGKGVFGDTDTDGHVDNLLAFVRPGEVSRTRVAIERCVLG